MQDRREKIQATFAADLLSAQGFRIRFVSSSVTYNAVLVQQLLYADIALVQAITFRAENPGAGCGSDRRAGCVLIRTSALSLIAGSE
jgi:hypothetical protein